MHGPGIRGTPSKARRERETSDAESTGILLGLLSAVERDSGVTRKIHKVEEKYDITIEH